MLHLIVFLFLSFLLILFTGVFFSKEKSRFFALNLRYKNKSRFKIFQDFIHSFRYLLSIFDLVLKNNFRIHFIWTMGFILWIFGCCFWVLRIEMFSLTLVSASIVFCLMAIFSTSNLEFNNANNLSKTGLNFSIYVLIISISVLTSILFNSLATGLSILIFLFIFSYSWNMKRGVT